MHSKINTQTQLLDSHGSAMSNTLSLSTNFNSNQLSSEIAPSTCTVAVIATPPATAFVTTPNTTANDPSSTVFGDYTTSTSVHESSANRSSDDSNTDLFDESDTTFSAHNLLVHSFAANSSSVDSISVDDASAVDTSTADVSLAISDVHALAPSTGNEGIGNYLPRRVDVLRRILTAMRSADQTSSSSAPRQAETEDLVDESLRTSESSNCSSSYESRRYKMFANNRRKKSSISSFKSREEKRHPSGFGGAANDREISLQQLRRLHRQHQSQFHHPHHHPQFCLDASIYGRNSSASPCLLSPDEVLEARAFRILGTAHIVCGVGYMFLHILEAIFVSSRLLFTIWIGFFYILVGVTSIFGYVKSTLLLSLVIAASAPPLMYFLVPKEICESAVSAAGDGKSLNTAAFGSRKCASATQAALSHSCVILILAVMISCIVGVACAISVLVKRRRRRAGPTRTPRSARTSTTSSAYYSTTTMLTATSLRETRREQILRDGDRIETEALDL